MIAPSHASAPELQKNTLSANVARDQPLGQPLLARDAVEVGGVPELAGLLGQRRDELGVRVAERVDGDARCRSRDSGRPLAVISQAPSPRSKTRFWRA